MMSAIDDLLKGSLFDRTIQKETPVKKPLAAAFITDFKNGQCLLSVMNRESDEIKIFKNPSVETLCKILSEYRFEETDMLLAALTSDMNKESKSNMMLTFKLTYIREIRDRLQNDIDAGKMVRIRDGKRIHADITGKCKFDENDRRNYIPEFELIMNDIFRSLKADQCFMKKGE